MLGVFGIANCGTVGGQALLNALVADGASVLVGLDAGDRPHRIGRG